MCSPLLALSQLLSVGWWGVCAVAPGQSVCPWPSSPFSSTSCWRLSLFPSTTSPATPRCRRGHTSWETWHTPTTPLWGRVVRPIPHTEILPVRVPIRMPKAMCERFLTGSHQRHRVKRTCQAVCGATAPTGQNLWRLGCRSWRHCLTILFTICPARLSPRKTGYWKWNRRSRRVRRAPRCGQYLQYSIVLYNVCVCVRFLLSHEVIIKTKKTNLPVTRSPRANTIVFASTEVFFSISVPLSCCSQVNKTWRLRGLSYSTPRYPDATHPLDRNLKQIKVEGEKHLMDDCTQNSARITLMQDFQQMGRTAGSRRGLLFVFVTALVTIGFCSVSASMLGASVCLSLDVFPRSICRR